MERKISVLGDEIWSVLFVDFELVCLPTPYFWCTGQKDNARGWDALYETSGPCTVLIGGRGGIMVRTKITIKAKS